MQKPDGVTRSWLRDVAWEAVLVVPAVAAYFAVRNVTAGGAALAFENADRIVHLERALGLFMSSSRPACTTMRVFGIAGVHFKSIGTGLVSPVSMSTMRSWSSDW